MPNPLILPVVRWLGKLSHPRLFLVAAGLFVANTFIWDPIPFVDEILLGIGTLLLPIALWLLPMLLAVRSSGDPLLQGYANNILFKQTGERYANAWHHHQPWWYFLGVMATQWLPAIAAVPFIVPRWREALKARPDSKVIFMSGYAEDAFVGGDGGVPGAGFLPKPFTLNELTEKVKDRLGA